MLGLSGGIDSALVATIACDALGPDAVHVVGMPSDWSSDHSVTDAEELARRQGLHWQLIPIAPMVDAWTGSVELTGLALENLQARVRGTTLMALSNEHGHLVLTTGNKSEAGDRLLHPVRRLRRRLRAHQGRPEVARLGARPLAQPGRGRARARSRPSPRAASRSRRRAELAPGQLDSDRLPPYDVLDALLDAYVEHDQGRAELVAARFDPRLVDRVVTLVDAAEYKRRQSPPGPKITGRAFGRDRRLPITSRWREVAAPTAAEPEQARPEQA